MGINQHTHANKAVLDATTASFTTASANTDSELSWATADPWPTTLPGTAV